jgi:hypothetical protein
MFAWKFLDRRGRSLFAGFAWPVPEGAGPGPWVEAAAVEPCRSGLHACRPSDLAWWLADELWRVQLGGDVVEHRHTVVASRARLVERSPAWSGGVWRELAGWAAERARASAASVLEGRGRHDLAARLRDTETLAAQEEVGGSLLGLDEIDPAGRAAALAADAAHFARVGQPCQAPFVGACAAGWAAGGQHGDPVGYDDGFAAERAAQSAWIVRRLGLDPA